MSEVPHSPASVNGLPADLELLRVAVDGRLVAEISRLEREGPEHDHALIGRVYRWLRHYLDCGGKRMHGQAVMLAYRACGGGDDADIASVAAAFQLYHHHTLVHDDIYDEDVARRGWPTSHEAFSQWFGSVGGDGSGRVFTHDAMRRGAITAFAYGKICRALTGTMILQSSFTADARLQVMDALEAHDLFDNAAQLKDVYHEGAAIPGAEDCLKNAWLKTGRLFEVCADAGGLLAGAGAQTRQALRTWAGQSALAYQLQDDLEDLVPASEKGQGRGIATDLLHCKPTYLYAMAMQLASGDDLQRLKRWQNGDKRGLDTHDIIDILERSGAIDATVARVRHCVDVACAAVSQPESGIDPVQQSALHAFTEYFVSSAYWRRTVAAAPQRAQALLA